MNPTPVEPIINAAIAATRAEVAAQYAAIGSIIILLLNLMILIILIIELYRMRILHLDVKKIHGEVLTVENAIEKKLMNKVT